MKERTHLNRISEASSMVSMLAWLRRHRFAMLFSSMLLFLGSFAILAELHLGWIIELLLFVSMTILVLGDFTHRYRIVIQVLIALSLLTWILSTVFGLEKLLPASQLGQSLAFALGSLACFRKVFSSGKVDNERIFASLSMYLLFGAIFALLFSVVEQVWPGSFRIVSESVCPGAESKPRFHLAYFSYVTLATVGYGDVIPVSGPAKTLAITEAIFGQMYLVVVVAKLVGLHEKES